jgi:hypothetical protein
MTVLPPALTKVTLNERNAIEVFTAETAYACMSSRRFAWETFDRIVSAIKKRGERRQKQARATMARRA